MDLRATGTITFLFTDLEGSTRLWEQHPDAMRAALARHDAILRTAIEAAGGRVVKAIARRRRAGCARSEPLIDRGIEEPAGRPAGSS